MSEEIMQNEATQAESMADYEAHFDDANPWNVVKGYMDNKTRLHIKIEGIVNGGAIAMVEGLRGFIPASRMSLSYIENLEDYLLKELDVIVIDVNEAENRLVLSAREILKEEEQKEREAQIAAIQAGSVLSGVVESIQNYGAFIRLENGLSGLVHISQCALTHIAKVEDAVNVGDIVRVKVLDVNTEAKRISLSIKEVLEDEAMEQMPAGNDLDEYAIVDVPEAIEDEPEAVPVEIPTAEAETEEAPAEE